ncbi:DMT family transporter [Vibrio parahaemolyticus]|uniref:DMT family transporter n=5 Tax=Vibrio parahaemolyticus TaxID=670 RepID=A0A0L8TCT5_VIBPH|nr:DMT family transporter [Vibrio parahaemolyticus]EFO38945.1 permease of the drug/metabolite transporter [Vibrio parahaemolyticus Peru-466]EFO46704.1 permease of the drug/metabolite transporter [Vibrio parahaemolyticus AQ4037]EFO50305.1 permease of the drug/metabolite transporter [Vibrio parahaemolyticus K5030]EJG0948557.1 DMT family transporter [Vibrio parahaemolyticus O1:K58]KCV75336.1 multidrug DMT transporter [Vibrio parahaemolyticus VP49]
MVYLLPFFTVMIWGGNSIVNKMAASTIEPSAMSFYRWFVAMVLLTPFCLPAVIKQRHVIRPYLTKLAFLALLGMVLNQSLGYYAGLTTTASNMALITSLVPLISVFLSVPLLGKSVSMLSIVGGVISLGGLAFMLGHGDVTYFLHQDMTQGDSLMLLAALVYAAYCVLLKRWKMPFNSLTLVYMQGFFSVIMLTPLWLSSEQLLPSQEALPLIAYAGIAASIFAPLMWVKAIDLIGADSSAMFMNLMPVVSVALASTLLGEEIHVYHIIGGLMVISGVILSQIKVRKKQDLVVSESLTTTTR